MSPMLQSLIRDVMAQALGPSVGLAIGLLIGIERERSKGEGPTRAAAGVRTFAILGLTGAVAGMMGKVGLYIAGIFISLAIVVSYVRTRRDDPGLTTEIAMLLTFLLGGLALSSPKTAGAIGVVVAILLASKRKLHAICRQWLSEAELQDLLTLLAAAFVVLPLLPDHAIDPWGAINPRRLWVLAVAIMSIATLGYLALRVFGTRFGLAIAGLASGFVSSTATVLTMAERAKLNPAGMPSVASAAIMSNVGTIIQLAAVIGSASLPLLHKIAAPLIAAGVITILSGLAVSWKSFTTPGEDNELLETHPFQPASVLRLVGLLAAVMFVIALVRANLGAASLPWMMVFSGLADVHAAAAAVAQAVSTDQIDMRQAVFCVAIAVVVNGFWKCAVAFAKGQWSYGIRVAFALTLANTGFSMTAWMASWD
jgi:uncharacterized membrane protein (DUF4010 family)